LVAHGQLRPKNSGDEHELIVQDLRRHATAAS
jgi:hypothetical protein